MMPQYMRCGWCNGTAERNGDGLYVCEKCGGDSNDTLMSNIDDDDWDDDDDEEDD